MQPQQPTPVQPRDIIGRDPMDLTTLIKLLHENGWPAIATVAPEDFMFLMFAVNTKFEGGTDRPYFVIGPTKVLPKLGHGSVDLSDWKPEEPRLIEAPTGMSRWG